MNFIILMVARIEFALLQFQPPVQKQENGRHDRSHHSPFPPVTRVRPVWYLKLFLVFAVQSGAATQNCLGDACPAYPRDPTWPTDPQEMPVSSVGIRRSFPDDLQAARVGGDDAAISLQPATVLIQKMQANSQPKPSQRCKGRFPPKCQSSVFTKNAQIQRPINFPRLIGARIGEASNPGPFTIGTANPTGVLGKAHLLQELPGSPNDCIWGLSETHLTKPGLEKFRFELKMQSADWRFHPGGFAPPLSSSPGIIGGKATGVGTLTKSPVRSLHNAWSGEDWSTARLQASAVFVQQNWIKVGVFYGFAKDAHTKATQDRTDELLANLTQRIVLASQGYRVIMGDFNCLPESIPQFAIWRAHGFQEIQELALHRWQRPVENTCKGKSVKDHVWVSPELADKLIEVHTDTTYHVLC